MIGLRRRIGVGGRAFEALWIGQTVSAFGTQVSMVALPLIAVLVLHASPLELGSSPRSRPCPISSSRCPPASSSTGPTGAGR